MKRFVAHAAGELLLLRVAFLVQFERPRGGEATQANLPAEFFDSGLVPATGLGETLQAVSLLPVCVHVLLVHEQTAVKEKGFPTAVAHEGFGGTMDDHVGLELVVVREGLSALLAAEGRLPCVDADVSLQVVVEAKASAAEVAGEGFLSGVDHTVALQGGAGAVRAVADTAYKGCNACVFSLVHSQRVGILKTLLTLRALVLFIFGVNHLVEAQRVFALEVFAAGFAAERPLLRVHHHVRAQLH